MTVTSATSAPAPAAATDAVSAGHNQLVQSFDSFLTLLTAQIRNQDPLSPTDSTQFTQQLVQMTGVQQQLAANDFLKQLVAGSSLDLIGKQVTAVNAPTAQLQDGKASWQYKLGPGASDVKIEVLGADGRTVAVSAGDDKSAGEHTFNWDGKSTTGKKMPDGAYDIRITAKDANGNPVAATTFFKGVVSGVEQANNGTMLTIGGVTVPLSSIISVAQPPSPPATTNTDSSNDSNDTAGQTPAAAA